MKKVMAVVMVVMVMFAVGCSSLPSWFTKAQDFVCNPTDAQKAEAAKWLTAMDALQAVASTFYPAAGIVKASSVMTTIQQGGCFLAKEVEDALNLLQSAQSAQAAKTRAIVPPISDQFPALWAAVQRGKK